MLLHSTAAARHHQVRLSNLVEFLDVDVLGQLLVDGCIWATTGPSPTAGLGVVASSHASTAFWRASPYFTIHLSLMICLTSVALQRLEEAVQEHRLEILDEERPQRGQEVVNACLRITQSISVEPFLENLGSAR